jgi:SOS-response transcriptional repressor LexA
MKTFYTRDILNRLKKALNIATDNELSTHLGVSKATISNWCTRNSLDFPLVFSFCEHININWLLTGEGRMVADQEVPVAIPSSEGGIPLIPFEAMAGVFSGELSVTEAQCETLIVPGLKADFVIPVSGNSMEPRYYSGDMVACQNVSLSDVFFQWGRVYVIDTNQGVLLKRVKKGSSPATISLVSENPGYEPVEFPRADVHHIALVRGLVRIE